MASDDREWSQVFESLEDDGLESIPDERYSIYKEIGRGGAKIVFRGVDNNSGREVAYARPLNNEELFLREARITAYLQHPNILPVYDVSGEENPFFVCKLLRGKTLSKIRPKVHTQNELLAYFRKICEAMEYAHSRGVLHLDLKPDNIRLDKYGEVLVFDWGLAEIFCTESVESPLDNPLISVNESIAEDYTSLGTPGYMSPEQIEGKKVDIRTDIFSLGALLYFIFHRKAPFTAKTVDEIFDKTIAGNSNKMKSDLSISLASIISKCLSVRPGNRYKRVRHLIADLDAIEKNYVPVAENASSLRHLSLLYKRNKIICNLVVFFIVVFAVLNTRYIKELNASKSDAVFAKNKAEKYLLEALEEQKKNEELTKALSPRYYLEAKKSWDYYQIPEALKSCEISLKLDPQNKNAQELKGLLLFVMGKYKAALNSWSKLNSVNAYKKVAKELESGSISLDKVLTSPKGSLKLREPYLRILLKTYRETGNIIYLQKVIKNENKKIKRLKISFSNGVLNLENNKELENINFLGGLSFDSLILKKTRVDNLSALQGKVFKTLDISETDIWEFFTLEGAKIEKIILGVPKATSLWALTKVKVKELHVTRPKESKIPNTLINSLEKLTILNSKSVQITPLKNSNLLELDLSGSKLLNPQNLLKLDSLKRVTIDKRSLSLALLNGLRNKGIEVIQSSSSLKR